MSQYYNIDASQLGGYAETAMSAIDKLSSLGDIKKKREYDFAMQNLNIEQQRKLNKELLRAKTNEERFALLTNAKTKLEEAKAKEQGKANLKLGLIVVGGGIILLIGVLLIKKM